MSVAARELLLTSFPLTFYLKAPKNDQHYHFMINRTVRKTAGTNASFIFVVAKIFTLNTCFASAVILPLIVYY